MFKKITITAVVFTFMTVFCTVEENQTPTDDISITLHPCSDVTSTSAIASFDIVNNTNDDIGANIIYGTNKESITKNYTMSDDFDEGVTCQQTKYSNGPLSYKIISLNPNTTYYVRVYAGKRYNTQEIFWSNVVEFTTIRPSEVVMGDNIFASEITSHSAKLTASILSEGIPAYTERGFCYDFNDVTNITIANNKVVKQGTGEGEYSLILDNLKNGRKYNVRAYGTNIKGTFYSPVVEFRTNSSDFLLSDSLIAYYNFNNEDGMESQNIDEYNGIAQWSPTFSSDTPDGTGKSLFSDSGEGYFYIENNPFKSTKDNWTITFWTKTMNANTIFFDENTKSNTQRKLSARLENSYLKLYGDDFGYVNYEGFDIPLTTILLNDEWHLITITREKTQYKLYIDGIYYRDWKYNYSSNYQPLLLGKGLKGKFDNFRVYDKILTQGEITTLFNAKQ